MSKITRAEWVKEINKVGADKTPPKFDDPHKGGGWIKLRGTSWYINFWRDGREISRVLKGAATREQAREMADRLLNDWDSGKPTPRGDIGGHPEVGEDTVLRGRIYLLNKWWHYILYPHKSKNGRAE